MNGLNIVLAQNILGGAANLRNRRCLGACNRLIRGWISSRTPESWSQFDAESFGEDW